MALQVAPSDYAMFGGASIKVEHALFDVEASGLAVVADLFGEDRYFADSDAFWRAQDTAIAARREAYLDAGWPDVVIVGIFVISALAFVFEGLLRLAEHILLPWARHR